MKMGSMRNNPKSVSVLTEDGKLIAKVSNRTTSVGASKVAGGPVEWNGYHLFGYNAWVRKTSKEGKK